MSGGLNHEGAVVVADAGNGWYFRRMEDGSVGIVKYRVQNPHESETPQAALALSKDEWERIVVEITEGIGGSTGAI